MRAFFVSQPEWCLTDPKGPKQRAWVYEYRRLERVPSCHTSSDRTREEELKWDD